MCAYVCARLCGVIFYFKVYGGSFKWFENVGGALFLYRVLFDTSEDSLAKNYGSGNEEHEPQLGHHPEAGQRQTEVGELRCCPKRQLV